MFTHVAHFNRKVRIYIATKLFQFASRKEPWAILAGSNDFFQPCSRHHVRPSYGDFLNSFAMKVRVGPYRSYDDGNYAGVSSLISKAQVQCALKASLQPQISLDTQINNTIIDKQGDLETPSSSPARSTSWICSR